MNYSFIMPYYDRSNQLRNTLDSFVSLYKDRVDFEIIIVEDAKNAADDKLTLELDALISEFQFLNDLDIRKVQYDIVCCNPAGMYNVGVQEANGEYLIITNPECMHEVDVLTGLDEEFENSPNVYVVCSCKSLYKDGSFHRWYQHTEHRDVRYHFCSAISKEMYLLIGGFNEKYVHGYGYEDNAFRDRVYYNLIPFVCRDDLVTAHQAHGKARPKDYRSLLKRNETLYKKGNF